MQKILDDDALHVLLILPTLLSSHRIIKNISYFYFALFPVTFGLCMIVVIKDNLWYLIVSQYTALSAGSLMALSIYVTMYLPFHVKALHNLYNEIFPTLWSLQSVGQEDFEYFQKIFKLTKGFVTIVAVVVLAAATAGLPWSGNHYDTVLPVKVAMDYLDKTALKFFFVVFYIWLYHVSLTGLGNVSVMFYLLLHLYAQFRMLNSKLKQIGPNSDEDQELRSCVKHHQTLLRFAEKINEILYYPLFYYTGSGIVIALALILVQKGSISQLDLFVTRCVALNVVFVAATFCWLGQIVENESEKLPDSVYSTTWYVWNIKSRKTLLIFLAKTQENVVLSSSGLVTLNYQLLVRLYRVIYSTLTFLINVSKISDGN